LANAGAEQSAVAGTLVTLTGSATDEDDDKLQYEWSQLSGGPRVELSDWTAQAPTFVAPAGTDVLRFQLLVNDGKAVGADEVTVVLNPRQAQAPARFTYVVTKTASGAEVRFDALSTSDARWDFGDGSAMVDGVSVTHTFPAGTYAVTMHSGEGADSQAYSREVIVQGLGAEVYSGVSVAWLPLVAIAFAFVAAALACVYFVRRRK
jgi:hypothetical protein